MLREALRFAVDGWGVGSVVGEAADGLEALRLVKALKPDILILGLAIPGLGGVEVVRRLRAEGSAVKILALTDPDHPAPMFEALRAGVDGLLSKAASLPDAAQAVETVATGRGVTSRDHERAARAQLGELARRARSKAKLFAAITRRERQVLDLIVVGKTTRQIATALGMSERTAETHISHLYAKLEVGNRVAAVHRAASLGLVALS
jgi:DNA-binding NarL/FixJ family response regulator